MTTYNKLGLNIVIAGAVTLAVAFAASAIPSDKELLQKAKDSSLDPMPTGKELAAFQQQKIKETGVAKGYSPLLTKDQI